MFGQVLTTTVLFLALLGSFTLASGQEPKKADDKQQITNSDRHEAGADPRRGVYDGQPRVRSRHGRVS